MLKCFGGVEGDRTPDLMTASHALSQLSYDPILRIRNYQVRQKLNLAKITASVKSLLALFACENRFAFFQKRRYAFFFVFGRKTDGEQINFAAQAFV